ncbi:MAG: DUF3427 domain-containing protein [Acetatifactor sp.]|nr:DUF3427 domain-containing protein [Acetatifactor sp.]
MKKLPNGLYEKVLSVKMDEALSGIGEESKYTESIGADEAPSILAAYLEKVIKAGLEVIQEKTDNVSKQVELVNKIIGMVNACTDGAEEDIVSEKAEQLKAILQDAPLTSLTNRTARNLVRPETSIAMSSLFTGAHREPNLYTEINKEIGSCNRIDMMVSFIRWSGVRLIMKELQEFTESGHSLRIITTSYMGATEFKAIDELSKLKNTEIKISYDGERTRLHAKVYVFHRDTGYSTAYVGSSNLTQPAMTSGCEWNVKFTKQDSPDVFDKVEASYNGYWNSGDFEIYDASKADMLREALQHQRGKGKYSGLKRAYFVEARPYPYQQAILDRLNAEREIRGSWKNLVSAATGTGKTIIAAFDYKSQVARLGYRPTLLFIAHRREILEQSIECFREVLGDSEFADLYVGSYEPSQYKYLFISNDMINSRDFMGVLNPDFYEYIVFDECHHIAAKTYQNILEYFKPKILLGLTATPYRMDGVDILQYFNNRIATDISLADAIDRKLLCPFQYFGVADDVDLSELRWTRGGYEKSELLNVYVYSREIADKRARLIIHSLNKYIDDIERLKGLAFCVSVEHAKYMAEKFNEAGIPSEALSGQTSDKDRIAARNKLESGAIKLICVVDLYNEGIDIKQINTVLFLRPTESLTIFLQQLGRGLRLADGKDCLTVLDYVGQANKKYNFEMKFRALLQTSNQGVKREIEAGFPHLPRGCFVSLERKARDIILSNIRNAITEKMGILDRLQSFEFDTGKPLTFANFIDAYDMTPQAFYAQRFKWTFCDALEKAGLSIDLPENRDQDAWKKIYRFTSIDDIAFLNYMIQELESGQVHWNVSEREVGYWKIMYASLYDDKEKTVSDGHVIQGVRFYFEDNPRMKKEIYELFLYLRDKIDFIAKEMRLPYPSALKVHCTYTRRQALATLDSWSISSEGMYRIPNKKTMCLFVTLNKGNTYYSPTTSYHDYSISDKMFHWQSQNSTSDTSIVGKRYINHVAEGESILLFVREQKDGINGSVPFTLLGKANYVSHTGNKPMSIIWELEETIPAKYLPVTDQLGIG